MNVKKNKVLLYCISDIILILYIFYNVKYNQKIKHEQTVIVIDTTYNTVVLDSIKYNIIYYSLL